MRNKISLLCIKVLTLIATITILLLPFAVYIHDFQKRCEPRSSLLNRNNLENYSFALIGDSAFCSYYVSNYSGTIWKRFESITGEKCFPGALDGAQKGDIVNAAKYISQKLPANSTVFVDIIPTRFMASDRIERDNYKYQFANLFREEDFVVYKYFNYFDLDYPAYMRKYLTHKKNDLHSTHYNRVWNIDGDFAKNRFDLLNSLIKVTSAKDMHWLEEIASLLRNKKINVVFIMTPINKKQIYAYSDKQKADQMYFGFKEIHDKTKAYLNRINAPNIDLFESVPENCFADLMHTNACGDEIIAQKMAAWLVGYRKSGKSLKNEDNLGRDLFFGYGFAGMQILKALENI